jgi:hypothetical protein
MAEKEYGLGEGSMDVLLSRHEGTIPWRFCIPYAVIKHMKCTLNKRTNPTDRRTVKQLLNCHDKLSGASGNRR